MDIEIKRVYDQREEADGLRVLVDRLWPRGLTKEKAAVDVWAKNVAPSDVLRKWYKEDESRWKEFRKRYSAELDESALHVADLAKLASMQKVTLLFACKDEKKNHALILRDYLSKHAAE
jgi:uncharacterized protein YeaO (DUF488 family)